MPEAMTQCRAVTEQCPRKMPEPVELSRASRRCSINLAVLAQPRVHGGFREDLIKLRLVLAGTEKQARGQALDGKFRRGQDLTLRGLSIDGQRFDMRHSHEARRPAVDEIRARSESSATGSMAIVASERHDTARVVHQHDGTGG
ncbi:hypothetical protein B0H17DRAFT_1141310 [Mycena rosella]|uniref:Uncharacterized protein n=1 Tax=Mycena rosella TaxID=1033263 RepID=A0AAD7GAB7_MYCRO|nr:hypothetical protein B0H17DRAFT_1141310 [Mycena rosella]